MTRPTSGRASSPEDLSVLLVTSSGGVLADLLGLRPWWEAHQRRWVAVRAADTQSQLAGEVVRWADEQRLSRPWAVPLATLRAWRDMRRARPDIIISAGTGIAVGYFCAARLLGVPALWVETFNIVGPSGVAARICGRLASRVLVQRSTLLDRPQAVLVGELQ
jgi:hypothetical protein